MIFHPPFLSACHSTFVYLFLLLSLSQPLVFGAMIHRDEAFDAIFTQYMKKVTMTSATNPET